MTFHLRDASYSSGEPIVAGRLRLQLATPASILGLSSGLGYLLADVVGAPALLALWPGRLFRATRRSRPSWTGSAVRLPTDGRSRSHSAGRPSYFPDRGGEPGPGADCGGWITRPGATEAGGFWSSGPFVLTEWVHDQRRTLEPNPMWWGEPITLERIEMQAYPSEADAVAAFRGWTSIDILDLSAVPGDPALAAEAVEKPGSRVLAYRRST